MKKLRIILQSKIFLSIIIIFTIIFVFIANYSNYHSSQYSEMDNIIEGIITSINIDGNKVNIILNGKEKVIVNYYLKNKKELELFKSYQLGYKIKVNGIMNLPQDNTNFNLFNYRKYLLSKKIYYIMNADSIEVINKDCNLFYKIKNKIINRINKLSSADYLNAFLLGNNKNIDSDILESYQKNGISHLFALSGLHVTIFSSIILFILNKIKKNKKYNFIVVCIFLIFYMFLTGLSPAIVRAVLLFILININTCCNLNIKNINLYVLLTCTVLLDNPYIIYNNAFLFSYIITLYLILFGKIINRYSNYFIKLLITSFISFFVSIPIMINSYFSINIISIIYNLFFVPFVSFVIFPLSLITFICPYFDLLLVILVKLLEGISLFLSKIELFKITLMHMSILVFFLYYFLITFILIKINNKKYLYLLLIIITITIHKNYHLFNSNSYISFLDVGQGDSILISFNYSKGNILIDTGGKREYIKEEWMKRKTYSISDNTIIPYLKSLGIDKLNYLIITHGDFDHMGESINLVNNFKVEKVIFNCGEFNELEQELIKVLNKKKIPYYSCIKELNIDNNKLYFLQTKEYDNENDNSNVIYTEIRSYKFMFMGDASITPEKDVLDKYNISNIDVLKVGHHGSKTSSSESFINEMNPKYSIISVGKNNRYGHPNKEVLNNLNDSKIYRTDQDGSIMFKIKNNKLQIETCSP